MQELPLIVARREDNVAGYVVAPVLEAQMHIPIVQVMTAKFPASPNCFIQGLVCVATSERGKS